MNLGKVAWDKMFAEGSFDLPPTRFMEKVKQAVTEADFQHIKREILNTLKDEKDHFCGCNYSTLTEAKNKFELRTGKKENLLRRSSRQL